LYGRFVHKSRAVELDRVVHVEGSDHDPEYRTGLCSRGDKATSGLKRPM
jgi:hypothetical protein